MPASLLLPCLCLVADASVVSPVEMPHRVAVAVEGGVSLVQLRGKELPGGVLLSLAHEVTKSIGGRAPLLVNERVDVAVASGAAGVQLGEEALPVSAASSMLPAGSLIGRSVHSVEGALQAHDDGADFLVVGTMFATRSHPDGTPTGPSLMRDVASQCDLPLIGIGGITPDNLDEVVRAGASGVAVIRSILAADDPGRAASDMMDALQESWLKRHLHVDNGAQSSAGRTP